MENKGLQGFLAHLPDPEEDDVHLLETEDGKGSRSEILDTRQVPSILVGTNMFDGSLDKIRPTLETVYRDTTAHCLDSWKALFYLYHFAYLELDQWIAEAPPGIKALDLSLLSWKDPLLHMPSAHVLACQTFLSESIPSKLQEEVRQATLRIHDYKMKSLAPKRGLTSHPSSPSLLQIRSGSHTFSQLDLKNVYRRLVYPATPSARTSIDSWNSSPDSMSYSEREQASSFNLVDPDPVSKRDISQLETLAKKRHTWLKCCRRDREAIPSEAQ
jgi:hypothetical protein